MKFMGSPEFNGHNNSTWFILRDNGAIYSTGSRCGGGPWDDAVREEERVKIPLTLVSYQFSDNKEICPRIELFFRCVSKNVSSLKG